MIVKLLETFLRHKWLILLPTLLIPLVVAPVALYLAPAYYETFTGVLVERAPYLTTNDGFNGFLTPAQNQTNRLSELLRTKSFLMSIASRTSLAPLMGSEYGENEIRRIFFSGFAVVPSGERLVVIRFRAPTPELSLQMTKAVVETFRERVANDRVSQAELATSFFEARLKTSEEEMSKANEALRRDLAANPRLTTIDPERGAASTTASRLGLPTNAIDPQLADLLRKVEIQQADVDRLRSDLEKARFDASAVIEGQEFGFQTVDPPQLPSRQIRERRKALIYPLGGLVVGLGLSAALLVALTATDRTVRSEAELARITRVVGTIPRLDPPGTSGKGSKAKQVVPESARRAVAYAAGASLPAPTGVS